MTAANDGSMESSGPVDALPVLNQGRLVEALDGDLALIQMISDLFLEKASSQISELEHAVRAGALEQIALAAHTVKGSAAEIGGSRLRLLAEQIEQAARNERRAMDPGDMKALWSEFEALCDALRATVWEDLVG